MLWVQFPLEATLPFTETFRNPFKSVLYKIACLPHLCYLGKTRILRCTLKSNKLIISGWVNLQVIPDIDAFIQNCILFNNLIKQSDTFMNNARAHSTLRLFNTWLTDPTTNKGQLKHLLLTICPVSMSELLATCGPLLWPPHCEITPNDWAKSIWVVHWMTFPVQCPGKAEPLSPCDTYLVAVLACAFF